MTSYKELQQQLNPREEPESIEDLTKEKTTK